MNIGGSETVILARTCLNSPLGLRCFLVFFFFFSGDATASVSMDVVVLTFLDDVEASSNSCFRFFDDVRAEVEVIAVGDIDSVTR